MSSDLNTFPNQTLCPVILAVPPETAGYSPKDRVVFLSRHARKALQMSAAKSGVRLDQLVKDENGVPQPCNGTFWSVTHKTQYVAGVASMSRESATFQTVCLKRPALTENGSSRIRPKTL